MMLTVFIDTLNLQAAMTDRYAYKLYVHPDSLEYSFVLRGSIANRTSWRVLSFPEAHGWVKHENTS